MDNPEGNRFPVWNPGPSAASHNPFIQSAAAESSSSVSTSSSMAYPALAAAASYTGAQPQSNFSPSQSLRQAYQDAFQVSGSQSQPYQSPQSSYRHGSLPDSYRDMPSGSEDASLARYQPLQADEDYMRAQAQSVGSSTGSQSGYHVQPIVMDTNTPSVPRVASPVDSTVSQSAGASRRSLSYADTARSSTVMPSDTPSTSGHHFPPYQASLPSYPQSEVSTSGGSPPVDNSQRQRDLELNQLHGEAETVQPQSRRGSHIADRDIDMEEPVSSISGHEQVPQRIRRPRKPGRPAMAMDDEMSGEPDTTQGDEEEFHPNNYVENTSSIDEAEALHTTMTSRSPARSSQPGPSTSNVIDSVMENEQLSSTQLAPHARMTSLTASMFNQSQTYRPSQSSETDLHKSDLRPVQISMPANNVPSTSQVTSQMINQVANELVRQFHTNPQFDSGMAEAAEEPDEPDMQYEDEDVEPDTGVVGSSAMVDQFASNGVLHEMYGSSSINHGQDDDEQPGTSTQSPVIRKSSRLREMEDEQPFWHRAEYQERQYDHNQLWCEVCQRAFDDGCEEHILIPCVDKVVFSRAWSSLPSTLQIFRIGDKDSIELGVFAKRPIYKFTQFGPFVGELVSNETLLTNSSIPIMVEREGEVLYIDTSDENKCNWMMFVRPAQTFAEQNLVMYQHGQDIYFTCTKPIESKGELKVWYASHYADRHGLSRLAVTEKDIDVLNEQECRFHCYECSKKFKTAIALQKHLFEHDEANANKVESTGEGLNPDKLTKPKPAPSQNVRKKFKAFKKMKETGSEPVSNPGIYHWKKRSTNIYLNKTLKKYHKRHESEAMRKSVQSMYRKTGKELGDNKWTCNTCDLTFDTPNLLNLHTLTHAAENVGLNEIKLSYQTSQNGSQAFANEGQGELIAGTSQETHTLACPVCSAQFTDMMALVQHVAEHGKAKTPTPGYSNHRPYKCDKCWKAFTTSDRLNQHLMCHGPEEAKPFLCCICNKRFMNNSALACHMKTHSCLKYYECPICHEGFDHTSAMREHSLIHANESGLFACSYCDKVFSEFLVLKKHIRGFHNTKYYPCSVCEKSFPREDKLRLHMLRHSNHRAFMCETCGKQFKRNDKLKEHIKRIHSEEREARDREKALRPPPKKFIPKVSPTDYHRFIYKCHLCLLGFKRRGMLVNHLANKHPGIKPDSVPELNLPILKTQRDYYCQYCDKVYKSSSKRKAHILKNHPGAELPLSGRKKILIEEESPLGVPNSTYSQTVGSITTMPHSCEHCHKQYASKAKLMQHQRKKHASLCPHLPAERTKREKIDIGQLQQEAAASVIHVVEAYDPDTQATESVPAADLLTQAMSELTQSIQEYRQNTPGAPDLYQVSARLGQGPPTMVQIQTAGSPSTHSTIELSQLTQALQQFAPAHGGHIQVSVSGANGPISIPIVTTQPGSDQPQIVTIDQISQASTSPSTTTAASTQAVSFPTTGIAYIPKTWTNYTYK